MNTTPFICLNFEGQTGTKSVILSDNLVNCYLYKIDTGV